jgi:hypothetical protein
MLIAFRTLARNLIVAIPAVAVDVAQNTSRARSVSPRTPPWWSAGNTLGRDS